MKAFQPVGDAIFFLLDDSQADKILQEDGRLHLLLLTLIANVPSTLRFASDLATARFLDVMRGALALLGVDEKQLLEWTTTNSTALVLAEELKKRGVGVISVGAKGGRITETDHGDQSPLHARGGGTGARFSKIADGATLVSTVKGATAAGQAGAAAAAEASLAEHIARERAQNEKTEAAEISKRAEAHAKIAGFL
jgi:hypothetical protein